MPTPRHPPALLFGRPVATHALLILLGFVALAAAGGRGWDAEAYEAFHIAPDRAGVWRGDYFSLLAAACLHTDWLQLLFSGFWLYQLGVRVETAYGPPAVLILAFCAAVLGSSFELGFGHWVTEGAVGVVYAFFGFVYAVQRVRPWRLPPLRQGKRRFLWMALPLVCGLGAVGLWPGGALAPLVNLVFGLALGLAVGVRDARRWLAAPVLGLLLAGAAWAWINPPLRWRAAAAPTAPAGPMPAARAPELQLHAPPKAQP